MIYRIDKGGILDKSIQVYKLLSHYGYSIEPTATGKPCQNNFIEVENYKIGRHLQSMHYFSTMDYKY